MSRVANAIIRIPENIQVTRNNNIIEVKGKDNFLTYLMHDDIDILINEDELRVISKNKLADVSAGTTRALLNNMLKGVAVGFQKKLVLVGVGYKAQIQGIYLNLTLGYSHPINYLIPDGIAIETPSQTEIIIRGANKQKVGQVAATIRYYRKPEPYKGKGIKYSDEQINRKEAKKK